MPAALRGGSRTQAKPRVKAPASSPKSRAQQSRGGVYTPGKLGTAQGVGLSPHHALLAAGGVLAVALIATLATGHRGERAGADISARIDKMFASLGFRARAVHVEGASALAMPDILQAAGVYKDQPLLGMDLEAMRKRVEQVGWVKQARIVRLLPVTMVVAVVVHYQLAVWQHGGKSLVVDDHGRVIPEADAGRFPGLPLVVGEGANEHAPEILPAIAQRPRLKDRLEALVRVDDRRWDLRMKDGSLVQLPAVGEQEALMQLDQLDQRTRILELGFERIDLRDPDMVAVRPRDGALPGQLVAGGA
ncbi:MAG: cell division protein FtsQ/DivIB [Phenylobacterium sp.]|uniref:cell division protein FtsQ/DivIB n=1 Tax=Phenylobacterium sp. TaxID=1871053 RepID=UPI002735EEB3|nr:cell division protein FtsQ/DivIB [Phenylobacterium sp.]MDP3175808.1 cell division protein FtsQ/DivIB [Phenylobacterium sp.]